MFSSKNYKKNFSPATRRRIRHIFPLAIFGSYIAYCVRDRFSFHYEKQAEINEAKALALKEKDDTAKAVLPAASAAKA